jgi:hypothetical protein
MPRLLLIVVRAAAIGTGVGMSSLWNGHRRGSEFSACRQFEGSFPALCLSCDISPISGKQNIVKGTLCPVNRPQCFIVAFPRLHHANLDNLAKV